MCLACGFSHSLSRVDLAALAARSYYCDAASARRNKKKINSSSPSPTSSIPPDAQGTPEEYKIECGCHLQT